MFTVQIKINNSKNETFFSKLCRSLDEIREFVNENDYHTKGLDTFQIYDHSLTGTTCYDPKYPDAIFVKLACAQGGIWSRV